VFVEVQGSGPPLLLLHGWAMHAGIFAGVIALLKNEYTVHAVDLPGHGRSADLRFEFSETLDALTRYLAPLPQVALVGWSLGGVLASELALAHPGRVYALLCIASSPKFVADATWRFGMAQAQFERFNLDLRADWPSVVERFLALEVFGSANEKTELRWLREQVFAHGRPNPQALQAGLAMLQNIDLRARLPALAAIPTVWLGGKRDRIVPPQAIQCAAKLSCGRAEIIERATHAPFLSHPELVLAALTRLGTDLASRGE
jgi:pimeloyl-[acyl-carrier protein] methyl ester esterase